MQVEAALDALANSVSLETVEKLIAAAGGSPRHGLRNSLIIRLMYGHALRLVETTELTWGQIGLRYGKLRVIRRRSGEETVRDLAPSELGALRHLKAKCERAGVKDPVFISSTGQALTPDAVRKIIAASARKAKIKQDIGPRVIRRSAGARVGAVTRDVDAVRSLMGVHLRVSAVSVLPIRNSKEQANPWRKR